MRPNVCVPILCVWCGSYCAPLCGAIVRRVLCKGARSIANLRCELSLSVWCGCGVCARVPPAEGDPVYARSESSDTVFHMRKITLRRPPLLLAILPYTDQRLSRSGGRPIAFLCILICHWMTSP